MGSLKQYIFREFSAVELCEVLGGLLGEPSKVSLPLLSYYVKHNYVSPSGQTVFRGKKKFSFKDLVIFYWLFKLKQQGLAVNKFIKCLPIIEKSIKSAKDLLNLVLITDGERVYIKTHNQVNKAIAKILTGRNKGQFVWLYGLSSLADDISAYFEKNKNLAVKNLAVGES